jgi:hypothetical protein
MPADESIPASRSLARAISIALGVWLFISAFVWAHSAAAQANTWVVGVLIVIIAVWSLFVPSARFANSLLALWLFFSTIVIPHASAATLWNNVIASIVLFFVSLIPSGPVVRLRTPEPA